MRSWKCRRCKLIVKDEDGDGICPICGTERLEEDEKRKFPIYEKPNSENTLNMVDFNEVSKQETIVTLYALRGGLSVLSEIYDEAERTDEEICKAKNDIMVMTDHLPEMAADKKAESRRIYENRIKYQKDRIKEKKNDISKARFDKKKYAKKLFIRPLIALGITATIVAIVVMDSIGMDVSSLQPIMNLLYALSSISIIVFLVFVCKAFPVIFDYSDACEALKKEETELSALEGEYQSVLQGKSKAFAEYEKDYQDALIAIRETLEKEKASLAEHEKNMKAISVRFEAAHRAMQEQFGTMIDERDWGNVDLIIFNYETGRALDMRDALMQVDNERRNERLIKAVRDASVSISSNIERGFGALQAGLNAQFNLLDRRITDFSAQTARVATSTAEQTRMLESKLSEIADNTSAQTALMNKMNTSSDRMADDINKMYLLENHKYYGT